MTSHFLNREWSPISCTSLFVLTRDRRQEKIRRWRHTIQFLTCAVRHNRFVNDRSNFTTSTLSASQQRNEMTYFRWNVKPVEVEICCVWVTKAVHPPLILVGTELILLKCNDVRLIIQYGNSCLFYGTWRHTVVQPVDDIAWITRFVTQQPPRTLYFAHTLIISIRHTFTDQF